MTPTEAATRMPMNGPSAALLALVHCRALITGIGAERPLPDQDALDELLRKVEDGIEELGGERLTAILPPPRLE